MAYEHQDWKPVILRREMTKQEAIKKGHFVTESKIGAATNKQTKLDVSARKIEQDDYTPPTVTHTLAMQIQQARAAKNMTQKELATKCMIPVSVVQQYERINTDGVVVESTVLQKMSRALGVTLKKPKVKKIKEDA